MDGRVGEELERLHTLFMEENGQEGVYEKGEGKEKKIKFAFCSELLCAKNFRSKHQCQCQATVRDYSWIFRSAQEKKATVLWARSFARVLLI